MYICRILGRFVPLGLTGGIGRLNPSNAAFVERYERDQSKADTVTVTLHCNI